MNEWGECQWTEAEALEELAFKGDMLDSRLPEVMRSLIAALGGHITVPAYWKEPIR